MLLPFARKIVVAALCALALSPTAGRGDGTPPVAVAVGSAMVGDTAPVSYCVDPDWPPYDSLTPQGQHVGIGGDLLRLVAGRAGLSLNLVPTKDWEESIGQSKAGACTLLNFLNQTPKRDAWLLFTEPLFTDPNVIITHEHHPFVADLAGLSDETLVLPKGTSIEERVRRDYPNLRILLTDSEADAFALLSRGKADLTIRSLTVAVYTIKTEGWFNLKIAGQIPGYDNHLRIGVLKSAPELRDRLNRAIATLTPQDRALIANRHVAITVQTGLDRDLMQKIALAFTLVLLTSLFWIAKLYRLNRTLAVASQTDALTGLANRASLNDRFAKEIERATRHKRPLSVIMCDLDHFKRVNDRLGHLAGDRMLREFAAIARASTRSIDVVARWGGEEFLILCPETDAEAALIVARRLCEAVRGHIFATGWPHSVSVGVASLRPNDTVDSLLLRADEALYQAKHQGRDQVCLETPLALPAPTRSPAL
ncbi:diguanylate cyclase [Azospirillum griseum]|uniref:diguanylate cyclase n=1 Tax=Azospirillum griseum TaxID=2496639 RepID=A0A3S0KYW9_9PROT|nr:diguanylate cyclase [Azospirillum griseum]RTR21003.1 diguanylate cyclase [Azospirillum griseum]